LEREARRIPAGNAHRWLERHIGTRLFISHTTAGEMASGMSLAQRSIWEDFLRPFHVLEHTTVVDWHYGAITRYLREQGLLIGSNDLWIAATALAHDLPVATRNLRDYKRVPGLAVIDYRAA
jgi:predicted nucleic acid-binding protein